MNCSVHTMDTKVPMKEFSRMVPKYLSEGKAGGTSSASDTVIVNLVVVCKETTIDRWSQENVVRSAYFGINKVC